MELQVITVILEYLSTFHRVDILFYYILFQKLLFHTMHTQSLVDLSEAIT